MLFVSGDGSGFEPYAKMPSRRLVSRVAEVSGAHAPQPNAEMGPDSEPQALSSKITAFQKAFERRQPTPQHAFLAGDIMTAHPVTIGPDQRLPAMQRIFTSRGFRHLPVVNDTGHLVGIVTDRDVLRHSCGSPADAARLSVRSLMTPRAFAATLDTTIHEIASLMLSEHISALPILSAEHDLIGIVTTNDILKGLIRRVPIELWV